ncbi:ATP-dependent DNA helicase RecG [Parvibium lacunae]|uniref:ATP-dependent DNA helicase RecG n=1 Tax=Parvibium lacunae TaxID=1888893 RepID=A0A368L6L3_9BURK|nr:ATP-dependent DNA helicase RecG [Parvibium lacunae]RCS59293.1 ATP-dependent DNA helicase RecG [Parvibium lacunae]
MATLDALLEKLGITTPQDLLLHLPLRYADFTELTPFSAWGAGVSVQVQGVVIASQIHYKPKRQLIVQVQPLLPASSEESGAFSPPLVPSLQLRFLYFYPSQQKQLAVGRHIRLHGELRLAFPAQAGHFELIHPQILLAGDAEQVSNAPLPSHLTPIYPTTAGLGQTRLCRLIEQALAQHLSAYPDTLPPAILKKNGLLPLPQALSILHQPPVSISLAQLSNRDHPAWQRVKFDELLAQQLSLQQARVQRTAQQAPACQGPHLLVRQFLEQLPFRLTQAQQRVSTEIHQDLTQTQPMTRLLQGDVGSGKTVVAAMAMLQVIAAGYQAALMAPTEILAEQHYQKLSSWLAPLGVRLAWLSASISKKERQLTLAAIASGDYHAVIGTHALIQQGVVFHNLGLNVIDEQHRFGVAQRMHWLTRPDGLFVHQLLMTATPIPRTLAMTLYADFDVSTLDELPPGRQPIVTKLIESSRREAVLQHIQREVEVGRQVYWVCPLIEESEHLDLQTALATQAELAARFPTLTVGLLHGRMSLPEKAAVMQAFQANQLAVLVATTVIEVGVDVPNATLMVIEHAERFGLAQLHQLRGRVGRGEHASVCVLLYESPLGEQAKARLRTLYEFQDGFEIANQDLLIRGPGEFLGWRQAGVPYLRYADLTQDQSLLELARHVAATMVAEYPDAVQLHLDRWLPNRAKLLHA